MAFRSMMRAAIVTERGGGPLIGRQPEPEAEAGTLKIKVAAAGLQPTDIMRSQGVYKTPALPYIIGGEGVGLTEEGARVYFGHSIPSSGAFAEWSIVPEAEVWPLPAWIDDGQAIALAIAGTGALIPMQEAGIRPGESVLVLGATGPVGQVALQAARALGAGRIVAAARTVEALQQLQRRGIADDYVQLGRADDEARLRRSAGGEGFDVVFDSVFGPPFVAALRASAHGARLVTVGGAAGLTVPINAWDMVRRTHTVAGTGYRPVNERRAAWQYLLGLSREGRMSVDLRWFDFDRSVDAWTAQLGSPGGKIIVRMDQAGSSL